MSDTWKSRFAQRHQRMGRSEIREMLKFKELPGMIYLAGGLPAPEVFPRDRFQAAAERILREQADLCLQYGSTEGYTPLRRFIAERLSKTGVTVPLENVVITSGSQQGLDLIGKILINPGDRVLLEQPTYLGALQAFSAYQAEWIAVEADDYGMCTDLLDEGLRQGAKFIYQLPNFQNPGGTTLPLARRQALVEASERTGVPVVEDDPYGELRFTGEPLPSMLSLDAALHGGDLNAGNVVYLGTFSKTLAPGLRLGYVVAPPEVIDMVVMAKQGADLHSSTFTQMLAYEVVKDGYLDEHILVIRRVYRERREAMLEALERYFPDGCSWTKPEGGLFLWVRVPSWINLGDLLPEAVKRRVAFVAGRAFFTDPGRGQNTMRLNFANARPEEISTGIQRLGELLKEVISARSMT